MNYIYIFFYRRAVLVEDLEGRPHGALLHQVLALHGRRQELRVVDLPAAVLVQLRGQQVQVLAGEAVRQARLAPEDKPKKYTDVS